MCGYSWLKQLLGQPMSGCHMDERNVADPSGVNAAADVCTTSRCTDAITTAEQARSADDRCYHWVQTSHSCEEDDLSSISSHPIGRKNCRFCRCFYHNELHCTQRIISTYYEPNCIFEASYPANLSGLTMFFILPNHPHYNW